MADVSYAAFFFAGVMVFMVYLFCDWWFLMCAVSFILWFVSCVLTLCCIYLPS